MDQAPAAEFGRYRMVAEPRYYGAGSLVAAREIRTDEPRLLWLLMPHVVSDPATRERVVRVATALRRISSSHLVRLHEFGEIEGQPFFAHGSVHGLDLAEVSEPDGVGPVEALGVIAEVGAGLDHLHHAGIVDGALGPRRLVVTEQDGEIRTLVRHAGLLAVLLPTSALFGTQKQEALDYGAPELHRGEAPTVSSDVYSLGSLLWHALTGEAPFTSYVGHRAAAVPQVAGDGPVEEAVNAVLRRAMAKDPADRYRDVGSFVGTLRSIAALAREVGTDAVPARLTRLDVPEPAVDPVLDPVLDPGPAAEEDEEIVDLAAASTTPYDVPLEVTVEPALRTAMDHWNEGRTVTIRRRRGSGMKGALIGAMILGGVVLTTTVGVRVAGRADDAPDRVAPASTPTSASSPARTSPLERLFPIAAAGHCVEAAGTVEHRLERWTCERRGYRVVLTRWDRPSSAAARVPHGGRRAAREVWEIDGVRAGTQWTWRTGGERQRFRWTAVYDDVPYAVTIAAQDTDRRRHARRHVAFRPSTVLG